MDRPTRYLHRWRIGEGGFIGDIGLREPNADELRAAGPSRLVVGVAYLHVHPLRRGLGWADLLLKEAAAWADRSGATLVLYIASFGSSPTPEAVLRRLYERHGFRALPRRRDESLYMVRPCASDSRVRSKQPSAKKR